MSQEASAVHQEVHATQTHPGRSRGFEPLEAPVSMSEARHGPSVEVRPRRGRLAAASDHGRGKTNDGELGATSLAPLLGAAVALLAVATTRPELREVAIDLVDLVRNDVKVFARLVWFLYERTSNLLPDDNVVTWVWVLALLRERALGHMRGDYDRSVSTE